MTKCKFSSKSCNLFSIRKKNWSIVGEFLSSNIRTLWIRFILVPKQSDCKSADVWEGCHLFRKIGVYSFPKFPHLLTWYPELNSEKECCSSGLKMFALLRNIRLVGICTIQERGFFYHSNSLSHNKLIESAKNISGNLSSNSEHNSKIEIFTKA